MTVADLKPGDRAVIKGWLTDSPPIRLMELGILPGTAIEVIRFAPLGDPIDIKVRGYHLSIRKEDASQIVLIDSFSA
jgi:ferrous iron transport protein A